MSKNKNKQMSQTTGKVETFVPTTLEQVWGDTGMSRYRTLDIAKYKENLSEMNKADLHAHASQQGIVPCDDRSMLERKLISEFLRHVGSYKRPKIETIHPKITNEVTKILSEGR